MPETSSLPPSTLTPGAPASSFSSVALSSPLPPCTVNAFSPVRVSAAPVATEMAGWAALLSTASGPCHLAAAHAVGGDDRNSPGQRRGTDSCDARPGVTPANRG